MKWLIAKVPVVRLIKAVGLAIAGVLIDAGLLGGQMADVVQAVLSAL